MTKATDNPKILPRIAVSITMGAAAGLTLGYTIVLMTGDWLGDKCYAVNDSLLLCFPPRESELLTKGSLVLLGWAFSVLFALKVYLPTVAEWSPRGKVLEKQCVQAMARGAQLATTYQLCVKRRGQYVWVNVPGSLWHQADLDQYDYYLNARFDQEPELREL